MDGHNLRLESFRVIESTKLWSILKGCIVLFFKNLKELAVFIEFTEVLEISVYRIYKVFQLAFRIDYIGIGVMLLFIS